MKFFTIFLTILSLVSAEIIIHHQDGFSSSINQEHLLCRDIRVSPVASTDVSPGWTIVFYNEPICQGEPSHSFIGNVRIDFDI